MEPAKSCPVCGCPAIIETHSMEYRRGHGYPGHFSYTCKCCNCKYIPEGSSDDVYRKKEEAIEAAIKQWNKNVNDYNNIKAGKQWN